MYNGQVEEVGRHQIVEVNSSKGKDKLFIQNVTLFSDESLFNVKMICLCQFKKH